MKQWLVVAELPEPLRSELNQLRTEVDRWSACWLPPHVTIVRPFTLALTGSTMTEIVRPIAVTAQILRWAIFRNPGNGVLYLEPTQEPFRTLRRNVLARAPELQKRDQSSDPFGQLEKNPIFHITIAAGVPNEEIDHIYSKVSQKTFMNVFQIHNLSLYSMESGGYWGLEG